MAGDVGSELSRGGMVTKIEAAKIAVSAGANMVIASGKVLNPLIGAGFDRDLHLVPGPFGPCDGAKALDRRDARAPWSSRH